MRPLNTSDEAPWKQRFWAPQILESQIAPLAPQRGTVVTNKTGVYQVYSWNVPGPKLKQLSDREGGLISHQLAPDGRHVYFLDDEQGNEIGHYVRLPYDGGEIVDITPNLDPYSPAGFAISRDNSLIALTAGSGGKFQTFLLPAETGDEAGEPRLLCTHEALVIGPQLSADGGIAVLASTERSGKPEFSLLAYDTASGDLLGELWDGEDSSIMPAAFPPVAGDPRLLARTNKSGNERPVLWDPVGGERRDLELPQLAGAVDALGWSPDATRLLLRQYDQAEQTLYLFDLQQESLTELPTPGVANFVYFTPDGSIFAHVEDPAQPARLVELDPHGAGIRHELLAAGEVPPGRPWRSVGFSSSDGTPVQAWLATPEGEGPFPIVVYMIGGPGGVQTNDYSPASQAWLDHGFAWLAVNYRGCATFGREFESKIFGKPGHWEVEDVAAARNWLVDSGVANANAIFLHGWSYGGFITLMAVAKEPELWAGGMAGVAVADWSIQYKDSAEFLRAFLRTLLGGTPDAAPEQYRKSSPITYVENVRAPLLIIQGRHDTRTPARPVEAYAAHMQELGKDLELYWFDTGHIGGFSDSALAIEHQERMLRFAYRVLDAEMD